MVYIMHQHLSISSQTFIIYFFILFFFLKYFLQFSVFLDLPFTYLSPHCVKIRCSFLFVFVFMCEAWQVQDRHLFNIGEKNDAFISQTLTSDCALFFHFFIFICAEHSIMMLNGQKWFPHECVYCFSCLFVVLPMVCVYWWKVAVCVWW